MAYDLTDNLLSKRDIEMLILLLQNNIKGLQYVDDTNYPTRHEDEQLLQKLRNLL